jgi:hypothetical protein
MAPILISSRQPMSQVMASALIRTARRLPLAAVAEVENAAVANGGGT